MNIGDEGVVENDIGNGRHKSAVEAGVVAPETGMGVDGEDGRKNLRS